jgi:hypothetical protein
MGQKGRIHAGLVGHEPTVTMAGGMAWVGYLAKQQTGKGRARVQGKRSVRSLLSGRNDSPAGAGHGEKAMERALAEEL